jgi:hypothetical protein
VVKPERTQGMEHTITIEETASCRAYELWADAVREEMGCDTIPCPPPRILRISSGRGERRYV